MRISGVFAISCAMLCGTSACAQKPAGEIGGTRAELLKPLRTRDLGVGDLLFLKTSFAWTAPGCTIQENTTVQGQIVSLTRANGPHKPEFALRFRPLPCSHGGELEVLPVLIALQSHRQFEDSALRRLATARLEDSTIAGMFAPFRPGVPTSADTLLNSSNIVPILPSFGRQSGEVDLRTGEVAGLRGVSLELPTREPVTTLHCSRDLTFEAHETTFVLTMVPRRPVHAAPGVDPDLRPSPARGDMAQITASPSVVPVQEAEVCGAGVCQQASLPSGDLGQHEAWTVSLRRFGFQLRPQQPSAATEENAGVHFLGPDQVLLTFPLHTLLRRSPEQQLWGANPRQIRAVLLSRTDGHVLAIQDWTVAAAGGSFVWDLDKGRLLAQIGANLVILGPGLVRERQLPLPGPLVFLTTAAQDEEMLLASLHETHSPAEHRALASYVGPGEAVDEDYDLTALDSDLHPLATRLLHAPPLQPALFRSALVTAEQGRPDHWQIIGTDWTGKRAVLARVSSSCAVHLQALPGNHVLLRGCNADEVAASWFRILDGKGATLLKGSYGRLNPLLEAEGDSSGRLLALATRQLDLVPDSSPTQPALNLQVSVLDVSTGKALLAVHLPAAAPSVHHVLAFSPAGGAFTVVAGETLHLYQLDSR